MISLILIYNIRDMLKNYFAKYRLSFDNISEDILITICFRSAVWDIHMENVLNPLYTCMMNIPISTTPTPDARDSVKVKCCLMHVTVGRLTCQVGSVWTWWKHIIVYYMFDSVYLIISGEVYLIIAGETVECNLNQYLDCVADTVCKCS